MPVHQCEGIARDGYRCDRICGDRTCPKCNKRLCHWHINAHRCDDKEW